MLCSVQYDAGKGVKWLRSSQGKMRHTLSLRHPVGKERKEGENPSAPFHFILLYTTAPCGRKEKYPSRQGEVIPLHIYSLSVRITCHWIWCLFIDRLSISYYCRWWCYCYCFYCNNNFYCFDDEMTL